MSNKMHKNVHKYAKIWRYILYDYIHKYLIIFIFLALLLIPLFFWGGLYHVGGDDTRMYYVMPKPFFEQYSSSIITQNRLGTYGLYASPAFLTPFYVLIWIVSLIPSINIQFLLYGANLALGFLFLYLLLGLYLRESSKLDKFSRITASLAYVLSNFLINTLYTHELMAIYAVSVCPLLLYLFVRSVREQVYVFPIICAIIYSVLSATLITLPWYGAFFFSIIPLLLYELKRRPKEFIKMLLVFLLIFIPLNVHWIIHIVISQIGQESGTAALSLDSLQKASLTNANYIETISGLNSILAQLFQQERTGWDMPITFNPIKFIFLLPLLLGGIFFSLFKNNQLRNIYLVSLFSFLLTIVLFTPNVDRWSLRLFLFFNSHIPFFPMFKTAYDKFALPLAFQYSFLLSISLWIIGKVNRRISLYIAVSIMILSVYFSYMYLFPKLNREQFSTKISGSLNVDFDHMVSFLRQMDTGAHFAWLPMTFPSYIYVEDGKFPNHFYSGPSIITPLTNKIDYTGELSFDIPMRQGIAEDIANALRAHNYEKVGSTFQELGIRYLIVNKEVLPDASSNYSNWFWGTNKWNELQSQLFYDHIKGRLIARFGERYDLYEINEKYLSDVIYVTESLEEVELHHDVSYIKNNEGEYTVTMTMPENKLYIVLLEPYYKMWRIYIKDKHGKYSIPYRPGGNSRVFGHGNGWELDPIELRSLLRNDLNETELSFKILFAPKGLQNIGNMISLYSYGIAILLVIISALRHFLKANR